MNQVLQEAKHLVEIRDLHSLQELLPELPDDVDVPYLFQKVYLHACLKGATEIAAWLTDTVFPSLDPIAQIGLRQVFPYGRLLLRKSKGS